MDHKAVVEELVNRAQKLLQTTSEVPDFLRETAGYLQIFDVWTELAKSGEELKKLYTVEEQQTLKERLLVLQGLHEQVIDQASNHKEAVSDEMLALNKRAKALRTYIDRYPKRINITGTRKG